MRDFKNISELTEEDFKRSRILWSEFITVRILKKDFDGIDVKVFEKQNGMLFSFLCANAELAFKNFKKKMEGAAGVRLHEIKRELEKNSLLTKMNCKTHQDEEENKDLYREIQRDLDGELIHLTNCSRFWRNCLD